MTSQLNRVVFNEGSQTDIPGLFASHAHIVDHCEENREECFDRRSHVAELEGPTLSPSEATKQINGNTLPMSTGRLGEGKRVDFDEGDLNRASEAGTGTRLILQVDVDSIDVLARPLGGAAFQHAAADIYLQWNGNVVDSKSLYSRNNLERASNRLLARTGAGYGCYFMSKMEASQARDTPSSSTRSAKPVGIRVGNITSVSLKQAIPLVAIFPSRIVYHVCEDNALLPLRRLHTRRSRGVSDRRSSVLVAGSSILWYLFTELFLLSANLTTSVGRRAPGCTRMICCACPAKGCGCRIAKETTSVCEGELSIALCYMARFMVALQVESELEPQQCLLFEDANGGFSYDLDESFINLLESAIVDEDVRECLKTPILDSDHHHEHFTRTIWGPDVTSNPFGHTDIDNRSCAGHIFDGQPNPLRRIGSKAIPGKESAILQEERSCYSIHDLLLVAPTLLRAVSHGMKFIIPSTADQARFQKAIVTEFAPSRCMDFLLDIGYSMGTPGAKIHLTTEAAQAGLFMLPNGARGRARVRKGLSRYAASAFPHATGVSTQKTLLGSFGGRESMGVHATPEHGVNNIRRTKLYDADFHYATRRGQTEYQNQKKSTSSILHAPVSALFSRSSSLEQTGMSRRERAEATRVDDGFDRSLNILIHDNERRKAAVSSSQQVKSALRIEITYGINEEGLEVSTAMEHCFRMLYIAGVSNSDVAPEMLTSLPWWAWCPLWVRENSMAMLTISRVHELPMLALAIELRCLKNVEDAVAMCRSLAKTGRSAATDANWDPFLTWLSTCNLSKGLTAEIAMACARGWFASARNQVVSRVVDMYTLASVPTPHSPTYDFLLTGAEACVLRNGLPMIVVESLAVTFPVLRRAYPGLRQASEPSCLPDELDALHVCTTRIGAAETFTSGPEVPRLGRMAVAWSEGVDVPGMGSWDSASSLEDAILVKKLAEAVLQEPLFHFIRAASRNSSVPRLQRHLRYVMKVGITLATRVLVGDAVLAESYRREGWLDSARGGRRERRATAAITTSDIIELEERGITWPARHMFVPTRSESRNLSRSSRVREGEIHLDQFENNTGDAIDVGCNDIARRILEHSMACAPSGVEMNMLYAARRSGNDCPTPWPAVAVLRNVMELIAAELSSFKNNRHVQSAQGCLTQEFVASYFGQQLINAGFDVCCPPFRSIPRYSFMLTDGGLPPPLLSEGLQFFTLFSGGDDIPQTLMPLASNSKSWQRSREGGQEFALLGKRLNTSERSELRALANESKRSRDLLMTELRRASVSWNRVNELRRTLRKKSRESLSKANIVGALRDVVLKRGKSAPLHVTDQALTMLRILIALRLKCGGDEGLALTGLRSDQNAAAMVVQSRTSLVPIRIRPSTDFGTHSEQVPLFEELLKRPWGNGFKYPKPNAHRSGGSKMAVALLSHLGIVFKCNPALNKKDWPDFRVLHSYCVDEVHHSLPLLEADIERRIGCQVRLAPTWELLRIATGM